jgi:restriction system protein
MDDNITLWGIHAGRSGEAESLFLNRKVIALGWEAIGDLKAIGDNREAFKAYYASKYPNVKPASIPASAGQLFRFVHEMKVGDLVAFPAKRSRTIHLGKITGEYKYVSSQSNGYPQQRTVEWIKEVPRTHFSQGALYEIGSALSLFTVKTYADEFLSALDSKTASKPVPAIEDQTVAEVKHDVEETTSDFILKVLAQETKGHPFADFVGNLLQTMGYRTRVSPPGVDGGIDIVAHKDELGFEPPIIKVQVKSSVGSIGDPVISQLYGKVAPTEFGLFVTLGTFTNQAVQFARAKSNLRLIDGESLVQLILEHYEQLDSKYKGLIPLRRVYIPETAGSDQE